MKQFNLTSKLFAVFGILLLLLLIIAVVGSFNPIRTGTDFKEYRIASELGFTVAYWTFQMAWEVIEKKVDQIRGAGQSIGIQERK